MRLPAPGDRVGWAALVKEARPELRGRPAPAKWVPAAKVGVVSSDPKGREMTAKRGKTG